MTEASSRLEWQTFEPFIEASTIIEDGFGGASKNIITLPDGSNAFIKIGTDEVTRDKVKKEVAVYTFLTEQNYTSLPDMIAHNADQSGIALEVLSPEHGWDWNGQWTEERLSTTLKAMDELGKLTPSGDVGEHLSATDLDAVNDAWEPGSEPINLAEILAIRIENSKHNDKTLPIDFNALSQRASEFVFQNTVLVHNDVRRDNCAWNPTTKEVKLIDWDWLQIGDRRIDINSLLVNAQKSGFDVVPDFSQRLDAAALIWLADYWFKSAATPIWQGGKAELRDFQLDTALVAYSLVARVESKVAELDQ